MPKLAHLDQATGLPVRKPAPVRCERAHPEDLVHVDVEKRGKIPDGGSWRAYGRGSEAHKRAQRASGKAAWAGAPPTRGYRYLHHAVDDHSRLVYSEILENERKDTAAGFWARARAFFRAAGFEVREVMTDNGPCYRSGMFHAALGDGVKHRYTRPYRPQTNGKVERFNRTLSQEWA